jgi:hypothetical protein
VKFKITRHSGFSSPPDALDQLFEQLAPHGDVVSFSKDRDGITATWREGGGISRTQEELSAIGRLEVLEAVLATCGRAPELNADWYAVSVPR